MQRQMTDVNTLQPTNRQPKRRWFQFRLSTLMLLAFACGFVLHRGYLTQEVPNVSTGSDEVIFSTGSDGLIRTPEGVSDTEVRLELLRRASGRNAQHGFTTADIELHEMYLGGVRYNIVFYNKWCRRRFQVWNWRYVLDYKDEVARTRNVAMEQAIKSLPDHWSEALDVDAEECKHRDE